MSMVYNPVTREFKPREARGEKPNPADATPVRVASEEAPPPLFAAKSRRMHGRGHQRHHRRHRESFFYFLVVLAIGLFLGAAVWLWGQSNGNRLPGQEGTSRTRLFQFNQE